MYDEYYLLKEDGIGPFRDIFGWRVQKFFLLWLTHRDSLSREEAARPVE